MAAVVVRLQVFEAPDLAGQEAAAQGAAGAFSSSSRAFLLGLFLLRGRRRLRQRFARQGLGPHGGIVEGTRHHDRSLHQVVALAVVVGVEVDVVWVRLS